MFLTSEVQDSLREFVTAGLRAGDAVIVVAINAHREALLASLQAADLLMTFMVWRA